MLKKRENVHATTKVQVHQGDEDNRVTRQTVKLVCVSDIIRK